MKALVVQHDHVSPTGPVGRRLEHHGFEITEFLVVPETSFHEPNVNVSFPETYQAANLAGKAAGGGVRLHHHESAFGHVCQDSG